MRRTKCCLFSTPSPPIDDPTFSSVRWQPPARARMTDWDTSEAFWAGVRAAPPAPCIACQLPDDDDPFRHHAPPPASEAAHDRVFSDESMGRWNAFLSWSSDL